jgi:hypothetical protein
MNYCPSFGQAFQPSATIGATGEFRTKARWPLSISFRDYVSTHHDEAGSIGLARRPARLENPVSSGTGCAIRCRSICSWPKNPGVRGSIARWAPMHHICQIDGRFSVQTSAANSLHATILGTYPINLRILQLRAASQTTKINCFVGSRLKRRLDDFR